MDWWSKGIMDWWNEGMMELCNNGIIEWWNDGMMEWWNGWMVELWNGGMVEWRNDGMMERWNDGMIEWWNNWSAKYAKGNHYWDMGPYWYIFWKSRGGRVVNVVPRDLKGQKFRGRNFQKNTILYNSQSSKLDSLQANVSPRDYPGEYAPSAFNNHWQC